MDIASENTNVYVLIPMLDEEKNIGNVLRHIPMHMPQAHVKSVVVVDNGSRDKSPKIAKDWGAEVLHEPRKGYGSACLKALEYLKAKIQKQDIVVFMDADFADDPTYMPQLIQPIQQSKAKLVIGARKNIDKNATTPLQNIGNNIACRLMRSLYGAQYSDLGPFRAIQYETLQTLDMQDKNFGWTIEMQIKAHKKGIKYAEISVPYKKRQGKSKISGTWQGTIGASCKILYTIARHI